MSVNIIHGDCMIAMAGMKDGEYDLIITSPPYNLGNKHHTGNVYHFPYNDDLPESAYQEGQVNFLNECFRILKDTGSVFYNHKNRIKESISITPYEWILKTSFKIKQEIVWFNGSHNFDKCRFYPMTERIYWLSKSKETLFKNNINHHDFFQWQAEGIKKEHTRAFPIKMVTDILACFPKGKLLDPYLGSGSSAIAADIMGFDFVGIEIDESYFLAAKERLERHQKQTTMFDGDIYHAKSDQLQCGKDDKDIEDYQNDLQF